MKSNFNAINHVPTFYLVYFEVDVAIYIQKFSENVPETQLIRFYTWKVHLATQEVLTLPKQPASQLL